MKLSAPIYVLKNQAKSLKKDQSISMANALNQVAKREGFSSWSLLQSKSGELLPSSYNEILDYMNPGDLVLLGSRPTFGKTTFATGLLVQAINRKRGKCYYFTLSEIQKDIAGRIANYDQSIGINNSFLEIDYSDKICADYIIDKMEGEDLQGSLLIIDYLQLLDQQRSKPALESQAESLKNFASERGCIIIFLSQINRNIQYQTDQKPELKDIYLPNLVDLKLFNKVLFLYRDPYDSEITEVLFKKPIMHNFNVRWDKEGSFIKNF